jgi:hypothetical protein
VRPSQLLVDDELRQGIGIEAEGRRPVGHDVARLGELAAGGLGVLGQPVPDLAPARVVVAGEAKVHGGSVFSSPRSAHVEAGGGVDGLSAVDIGPRVRAVQGGMGARND